MIYIQTKKTNKQINNEIILKLLSIKLNGFEDICHKIISLKDENELEVIKNEYIETDFYNWLNHDVPMRGNYIDSKFSLNEVDQYYDIYNTELGLANKKTRVKSLSECFESKWWKTTKKNYYDWSKIHYCINFDKIIKIYHKNSSEFEIDGPNEMIKLLDNKEIWSYPTMREKDTIIKNYRDVMMYDGTYLTIINSNTPENHLLVDCNLTFIIY